MGLTDPANVDLQHSIKCDIDRSNFPRKTRQDALAYRMRWLAGYGCVVCAESTGSIPRSSFNNFFSLSLDEMLLK